MAIFLKNCRNENLLLGTTLEDFWNSDSPQRLTRYALCIQGLSTRGGLRYYRFRIRSTCVLVANCYLYGHLSMKGYPNHLAQTPARKVSQASMKSESTAESLLIRIV